MSVYRDWREWECIHGVKTFDKAGQIQRCPVCHSNAMGAINWKEVNKHFTKEEQKIYGLRR